MLTEAEIQALVRAEHRDPFAVLGAHARADGLWVRALLPGALGVEVLDEAGAVAGALASIHDEGLFEAKLDARPLPWAYRLRVHYPLGHVVDVDDPYRFASTIAEFDRHLLGEGSHLRPWQIYGAHPREQGGVAGVRFAVWAPDAARVAVVGAFNDWDGRRHGMRLHHDVGVWEIFVPGVEAGALYKYELHDRDGQLLAHKADPYAFASQLRPETASVVAGPAEPPRDPGHEHHNHRNHHNHRDRPISIYEVHLGSWRRPPDGGFPTWDSLAEQLPAYVADLGFTHVELLPIAEHPFDGSWGYQVTGMYAPTSRFGPPEGLARFLAACRERGLGVILDWVPAHFPNDAHGLVCFDGRPRYEYADPREGVHEDWNTLIYDFARPGVRNFLVGSALYWLERWGVDGLRVDAVASMLYRDYSRAEGKWIANVHGGRENLEAIDLLRRVNEVVDAEAPGCVTIAEESTAWPGVSRSIEAGGLGFHYKWNMGWMHDSLAYMALDPVHRKHHHDKLSFGLMYAFSEDFVLPLSHDEVVHGKGSLIGKMSGDRWQRFANLRLFYAFMWTHPGKKLLFMGGEFAQVREWDHDRELDWSLLDEAREGSREHRGIQALIRDLNQLYRGRPALHRLDCEAEGFEWLVVDDRDRSVFAFLRKDGAGGEVLIVCNFTPVLREGYAIGVPGARRFVEALNTDAERYGGGGVGNGEGVIASEPARAHGREHAITLTLPPLAALILTPVNE